MRTRLAALAFAAGIALPGLALADPCEAPLPRKGETVSGRVDYIVDGDGLCVRTPAGQVEIRLADFSAPELRERDGPRAKDALRRLVFGKRVTCAVKGRSYDRAVAVCTLNGRPLGEALRAAGVREGGR